mgnify:FL=1
MDPLSHFYAAFVPALAYWLVRYRRFPEGTTILLLFVATQFPDLVDKPLAWGLGVVPSGRMIAHSVVVAVPIWLLVLVYARRSGRQREGVVVVFGYASHLAGDFYPILSLGTDYYFFPNLFWPLLEPSPDLQTSFAPYVEGVGAVTVLGVAVTLFVVGYPLIRQYRRSQHHHESG